MAAWQSRNGQFVEPCGRLAGGLRLWFVALLALVTGCESEELPPPPERDAAEAVLVTGERVATASAPPAMECVAATVGVGRKGRGYEDGMVTTPVATYFAARERLVFDIMIPHALEIYKATEGRGPKTHEEFMEKIVTFNQIELPALPPGHRYVYDPKSERLMVERPQQ